MKIVLTGNVIAAFSSCLPVSRRFSLQLKMKGPTFGGMRDLFILTSGTRDGFNIDEGMWADKKIHMLQTSTPRSRL